MSTFDFTSATGTTTTIRTVELGGQPWFLATDVLKALGIRQSGGQFKFLKRAEQQVLPSGLIAGKGLGKASWLPGTRLR